MNPPNMKSVYGLINAFELTERTIRSQSENKNDHIKEKKKKEKERLKKKRQIFDLYKIEKIHQM